ncbi:hypothetical protein JTE90_020292 [Oedothorax gibbosus]|uniref:VASt domain-containing protein n=1 Tax=Oedothorax gibbosus TaxID=931172 RepID=A0AAV6VQB2_9ARAC|nr:hypothetical protein JTE90_020292 [Oedothorax gibbosus]
MSNSKSTVSDNHTSASENENDRFVPPKQTVSPNTKKLSHARQASDDTHLINSQSRKPSSTSLQTQQSDSAYIASPEGSLTRSVSDRGSDTQSPATFANSCSLDNDNQSLATTDCNVSPGSISLESSLYPDNLSRSSESGKSVDLGVSPLLQKTPESQATSRSEGLSKSEKSLKSNEKKEKKKPSWYNMLNPTYKSRSEDFKRLFKDLPDSERLIVDYSCALQKDILVHGRLYVSQNYICFYANIFRWETFLLIKCRDITSVTKEKTARVIPNAIQVGTVTSEKHFFTSFGARDKTFLMLFRIWQNALMEQPMSTQELWQWVHFSYGEELGLTSDDDDYVAPSVADDEFPPNLKETLSLVKYNSEAKGDMLRESGSEIAGSCNGSDNPGMEDVAEEEEEGSKRLSPNQKSPSDYPTDMSDTTQSEGNVEDLECICPCVNHEGKEVLNDIFPMSVDQVFTLIFTGSKFYNDLLESRKTYDILESPWQLCPEVDLKMRQVTYTLTLNHSMAKSAQTTETQKLLKHSKPGQVYTVDCDVVNTGIPYSDTFTVKSVYCITRVSKRECRLRISGCVRYKKSVWGLVKSLIEKSAMQGLADFATDLASALQKESELSSQQITSKKPRRRKRMKFDAIKGETLKDTPKILQRQPTVRNIGSSISGMDLASLGSTPDIVIRVILITLIILLFLNMLLFYKLWSLEDQSTKQLPTPTAAFGDSSFTKEDYVQLLQKQDSLHRAETARWREALSEVLKLIHLVEKSLSELKSSIDTYSSSSILKAIALRLAQGGSTEEPTPEPEELHTG